MTIVSELLEMDAVDYINNHDKMLPEVIIRDFFMQMVDAVHHCHQKGIMHRDIKLDNILLSVLPDGSFSDIKLCDFGQACQIEEGLKISNEDIFGTIGYRAPETLILDCEYDEKVDIYSMGVIIYMLVTHEKLYGGDFKEVRQQTLTKNPTYKDKYWNHYSSNLKDLVRGLLKKDPRNRMTMDELLAHPFMQAEE